MKKLYWLFLFLIFIGAYFLRVMYLPKNILTFGYDQARDAIISQQILSGDFKIQGPPASTPGLYHGVFYYYVLTPGYWLGRGSPIIAAYWIALLNTLTVFIVFYLTYLLSKKLLPAFLAAGLFAVSFEATQYATWLSNPTIAVWSVPLVYLGAWAWVKSGKKWGAVLAALGLGLSIQAEIFLVYHGVPLGIWLLMNRKKITKGQITAFLLVLGATLLTMVVNEVKFGFRSIEGIKQLALGAEGNLAYAKSVGDYLILYLNQIGRIFAFNSYPGNIGYGGALVMVLGLMALKKYPLIGLWLFSHATVVTVGGVSTPFLMVGIGPAVAIVLALFLGELWQKKYRGLAMGVLAILIFGNLSMILRENKNGATLFAIQKDMLLAKQVRAIDYTYEQAEGEPFSINSLTSPLWINIVWTYLYKWYGGPKYGYLPTWHGRDQVGILDALPKDEGVVRKNFLILEPMGGIPTEYLNLILGEEDVKSKLVGEMSFGELRVQERTRR